MILINNKQLFEELFREMSGKNEVGGPKAVVQLRFDKFEYETKRTFNYKSYSLFVPTVSIIKTEYVTIVNFYFSQEYKDLFNEIADMITYFDPKIKDINEICFHTITLNLLPVTRDDYYLFFSLPVAWRIDKKLQRISIGYTHEQTLIVDKDEKFKGNLKAALNN